MTGTLFAILAGLGSGSIATAVGAMLIRKKTKAEAASLIAAASETLATGAVALVPYYETRIAILEKRVDAAEDKASRAAADAFLARASEEACRARLHQLEVKFDELLVRLSHPASSTTVTTAVTTHPPVAGE